MGYNPAMQPVDAADYTGTGNAVTIAAAMGMTGSATLVKWFQVQDVSIGVIPARVGTSAISTSRGGVVQGGGAAFSPPTAELTSLYDLSSWYILVQSGEQVAISAAR